MKYFGLILNMVDNETRPLTDPTVVTSNSCVDALGYW